MLDFSGAEREVVLDKWVISTISQGYKLEFQLLPPPQFMRSNVPANQQGRASLFQARNQLLAWRVIKAVPLN